MPKRKSFPLRIDPAVHEALVRWANDDLRSVNAQIEYALRRALRDAGRLPGADSAADATADSTAESGDS